MPKLRSGTWGWRQLALAALLTLAMTSGPLTSFGLGALGPIIVTELDLGRAGFGLLTTIMFAVAAFASRPAGRVTDAVGAERVMLAGLTLAAAALLAVASASSYAALVVAACIGGLSVATNNPTTNKIIMRRVRPARQSAMAGVKQAGVLGAGVVAGSVLPLGAAVVGWRWPLVWCALLPVTGIVLARVVLFTAEPGRAAGEVAAASAPQRGGRVRIPGLFWLRWYAFAMGAGHLGVVIYLPLYAFEVGGLSATNAGFLTALLGLAGVTARIGLGAVGDRLGPPWRVLALLATLSALSKVILWVSPGVGPGAIWFGALLFGATSGGWSGVGQVATIRVGGERLAGTASGAVTRSYYLGFLASPAVFGYILELSGTYAFGWGVLATSSLVATVGARRFAGSASRARR